jgi:hypothetical protein
LGNRFSGSGVYDCAPQLSDRYQRHKPHLALRRVRQRRNYTATLDGNLHLRTGVSHANADRDSDGNAHTDSDAHCDGDGYAYADGYANGHSDSYAYFNADADAENCANSKASPYSNTAAVTFAIKKKDTVQSD